MIRAHQLTQGALRQGRQSASSGRAVVGAHLLPVDIWEGLVGERFGPAPTDEIGRRVHAGGVQVVDDRARLSVDRVPAGLGTLGKGSEGCYEPIIAVGSGVRPCALR